PAHRDTLLSSWGVAHNMVKLDRGVEALPVIDEFFRNATSKIISPRLLLSMMDLRLRHFEKMNDAAGCRQTTEMWENLKRGDAASQYNAARMRAVTSAVLRAADNSPTSIHQAELEADHAMTWLKLAISNGYQDDARLTQDKDLNVLRDREDFTKLVATLPA